MQLIKEGLDEKRRKGSMVPRQFIEMGLGEKGEPNSQQFPEGKLGESKSMVDLLDHQDHYNNKMDGANNKARRDNAIDERADNHEAIIPGWLSNKVPKLSSSKRDVDQTSETLSMIKKARVSVRARSESSMVKCSKLGTYILYQDHICS